MSVFICWSHTRSHKIALAVETLLKGMHVPVFVSDHIEKGATWFGSIQEKLNKAEIGIVCLTSENLESPWLHFESGALARELPSQSKAIAGTGESPGRLFTVLHGVTAAEVTGPLSAYQATSRMRKKSAA